MRSRRGAYIWTQCYAIFSDLLSYRTCIIWHLLPGAEMGSLSSLRAFALQAAVHGCSCRSWTKHKSAPAFQRDTKILNYWLAPFSSGDPYLKDPSAPIYQHPDSGVLSQSCQVLYAASAVLIEALMPGCISPAQAARIMLTVLAGRTVDCQGSQPLRYA